MANIVDQNGVQVSTASQIYAALVAAMQSIYGPNINILPSSPDGQFLFLLAQMLADNNQLALQVNAMFDPSQAIGVLLDMRCAINGVVRNAGTYSLQNVTVVASLATTLQGLDLYPSSPFTVADAAGNQYQLVTTYAFTGPGTQVLTFQAAQLGAVMPVINTITTIVTIQLGVTSVNNPTAATTVGIAEESDAALRVRRANSVALPSQGYYNGLFGALQDVTGVTSVNLLENDTGTTDSNGVPGNSIWAIIAGGANTDIANAIYVKRNAGCGLKGAVSETIAQGDGGSIAILFDRPTTESLFVSFTLAAITGTVDEVFIRAQILATFGTYQIGQVADSTAIVAFVKGLFPNASITAAGVGPNNTTYTPTLAPTAVNYQFGILSTSVYINGSNT